MTDEHDSGGSGADTIDDPTIAASPSARRDDVAVETAVRKQPAPRSSPAPTESLPTRAETGAAGFVDVLRVAEIQRTRRFVPICAGMGVGIALLLPFVDGHPTAKVALLIAIVVGITALLYLYTLTRDPARYTEARVGSTYMVCILTLYAGIYYFGVFSAAAMVLALGIFFVGIGRSQLMALLLYLAAALAQGGLSALIIAGVIPDYGLVTATAIPWQEQATVQLGVQILMLATYLIGRATRHQLDRAVADHEKALRQVARRDALLQEAREELDRAMAVGGEGRFSSQRLGSFELSDLIGRGAWGEVYRAANIQTGAPAAVKVLSMAALSRPGLLTRFVREATAVAKLDSPHIARLIEVGDDSSPLPYIAMELLDGEDLSQRLRSPERFTTEMTIEMITHIARGLDAAAAAGIVHRDIKPQNLFGARTGDGAVQWKLIDFGVSKLGAHQGTLTQGNLVGTPRYMAPEQAQLDGVDHRADVYALAAVAYRSLTGQPPVRGGDMPAILYDVVYRMPSRPSKLAQLSLDVDRAFAMGLAKSPSDRFASAGEFAQALERASTGRLPRPLRVQGDALIAQFPWGTNIGE